MTTQTKPPAANDPLAWLDDAVERATRWRNLYFDNDGKSHRSESVFDDEKIARLHADGCVQCMRRGSRLSTLDGYLEGERFSHHIQIPVGAE